MKTKNNLVALIFISSLFVQGSADACCGDGKEAAGAAIKAGDLVSQAISSATSAIAAVLEHLNLTILTGFGKLYAEIEKQTAAMRTFAEGNAAVQSQMHMERARAEAQLRYEPSPRQCFEAAGGAGAGVASAGAAQALRSYNTDSAKRTLFTPNTSAAVGKLYDDHVNNYCSQQDADLGRCSRPADPAMQNADVRADATLNTSSYTPDQIAAAQAFVTNVVNPMPTQNIPKNWESTNQGKTFVAGQYIEQARASVAANSLNAAVAERTPIQGLGAAAMLNKADVSRLELMESQVRGRFESPAWYKMIAGLGMENMMREVVKIMALQTSMDFDRYKKTERIEAVLATQLAISVEQDSAVRMRELRNAAAKAGR
ncbi:hypothetical protein [Sulfuricella sp.]|uniref:hypothetical protein n=1 Tax=Sulfuricella sp. TaxID=2099377 RepID=UPI002B5287CF|nr:hypothetical protein [Sulfuricella sp.]HUX62234.1 hypothetical protein [Sulfuricella sp.]